ncbi:MAG: M6 family metalloprotease domain-containing protein [Anaerolineaceae bacterium]|nr:M6 family metalloprotease domain-containing protein [Anaerolineaceae bacterium]
MGYIRFIVTTILAIITLAFFAGIQEVSASPAAPVEVTLTQPDGTSFQALPWGDEWSNGYESLAGYTILPDPASGWWIYASRQTDGTLAPALSAAQPLRVGIELPGGLAHHLRPAEATNRLLKQALSMETAHASPGYHLPPASGDMPVLVLLARFTNRAETYPSTAFEQLAFGPSGSLKSYYQEVSYGKLNLIPAQESCGVTANDGMADWRELPYEHPDTGSSSGEENLQLAKDILTLNDDCVDYASFDLNHDGGISGDELQVVVVVAGWEYAYGESNSPSIWAHAFYLDFVEVPVLDGVSIGSYYQQSYYAQIGEIHGTGENQHMAVLGVLAHEFGHLLNWPDLYDVDNSTEGVGRWSVMSTGSWNRTGAWAGDSPAHPDAWSRSYQGWSTPMEVSGTLEDILISQAEDSPMAYRLRPNPNGIDWIFNYHTGRGEYFLIENRQRVLYDAGLPGCGLLVWHINEQVTFGNFANAWDENPLLSLVQADGQDDLLLKVNRGDGGDPYPGDSGNLDLTFSSTPNSRLHSGGISGVSMHVDSTTCGASMQADLTYHLYQYTLLNIHKSDPTCDEWETMMRDDFENGNMDQWTVFDNNGDEYGEYYPSVSDCQVYHSSKCVWMIAGGADGSNLACGAAYPDHAISWMRYGPFSTMGETDIRLDFSHWTYIEPAIPFYIYDRFCVWASDDNIVYFGYCFTGDWGGWSNYTFNLKDNDYDLYDYLDKPQVWVAFSLITDDYVHFPEGAYVDDIVLRKCVSPGGCPASSSLSGQRGMLTSVMNPFGLLFPPVRFVIIGPVTTTLSHP